MVRPRWLDDETIIPPFPVMRCPRCKALFDNNGIHICADINEKAKNDADRKQSNLQP